MHVVIFEGTRWHSFAPLALSRPVFTLATGMSTLLEKQVRHLQPTRLTLWVRPKQEEHCRARVVPKMSIPTAVNEPLDDEPALLCNGRTVHFGKFEYPPHDAVMVDEGEIIRIARVSSPGLSPQDVWTRSDRWLGLLKLPHMMPQSRMVDSLWDLVHWNEESLIEDCSRLLQSPKPKPAGPFHMINDSEVLLSEGAKAGPNCVLDASRGPVIIAEGVAIGAGAVLEGPCYLAANAVVRPLTLIRPGTSIGPGCRVGGEISNSIMLGPSNKAHDGYLGDSYLGKWVNFGSGTTTSNLKNTYGEISVQLGSRQIPTGRHKAGSIVGDHVKTAILTRLMAGTYVGFCSMLAGSAIAPRFVPSYTFWSDKGKEPYRMDKAIEVTRRAYARRDREFNETDERVMRYVAQAAPEVEMGSFD